MKLESIVINLNHSRNDMMCRSVLSSGVVWVVWCVVVVCELMLGGVMMVW